MVYLWPENFNFEGGKGGSDLSPSACRGTGRLAAVLAAQVLSQSRRSVPSLAFPPPSRLAGLQNEACQSLFCGFGIKFETLEKQLQPWRVTP